MLITEFEAVMMVFALAGVGVTVGGMWFDSMKTAKFGVGAAYCAIVLLFISLFAGVLL